MRVLIVCAMIAGCRPVELAGESRGEFRVLGSLEENTCGAGYPVRASYTFDVELRSEPGSSFGYWKLSDRPAISGAVDADGTFRFEQRTQVVAFEADPSAGTAGCSLDHTEVVEGTIGIADAGQGALEARTTVEVVPAPGTQCSPLLTLYGGTFPALPCRIEYALEGEPIEAR